VSVMKGPIRINKYCCNPSREAALVRAPVVASRATNIGESGAGVILSLFLAKSA